MPDKVSVPGMGARRKGTVIGVTIGGFSVAAYLIYRYEKKAKTQSAAVANAQTMAYAYGYGVTGYGYGVTGYGYGFSNYPPGFFGYGQDGFDGNSGGGFGGNFNDVMVPSVVGQNYSSASAALSAAGLVAQRGEANVGNVLSESPPAGSMVTAGSTVTLFGSGGGNGGGNGGGGQTKVKVPSVTGERYPSAAAKITTAGLIPRRGELYVGVVTSEIPAGGSEAEKGTVVVLSGKGRPKSK